MNYLDHAATTPLDAKVLDLMIPYMAEHFANPSSLYLAGNETRRALEVARHAVAQVIGAKSGEIIFTSGGTESNNLALRGVMSGKVDKNVIVSAVEHDSVLAPAAQYDARTLPVKPDGRIDLDALGRLIDRGTAMVSIMYANNEIGTVQPLRDIASLIRAKEKEYGTRIVFHTDAAQAGNYLDLHVGRLDVDLMTLNSGKVYGPRAVGCLYVRTGVKLSPLLLGGGQESGQRSGTENVAGVVGFAAALTAAQDMKEAESKRLSTIQHDTLQQLQRVLPDSVFNSPTKHVLPNTINITIPSIDGEAVVMAMDQKGYQIATGSACHASSDLPSHVLLAIGRSEQEASASIRVTMGRSTTPEIMKDFVDTLSEVVNKLKTTGYLVAQPEH